MSILVYLLSSLISLLTAAGLIVDRIGTTALRRQLVKADQLQVRVDATPSYELAQGKADRIRIAGRGIVPLPDVRLHIVELETDPIQLSVARLQRGEIRLERPLRAGVRIVLRTSDINRAFQAPAIARQLTWFGQGFLNRGDASRQRYELLDPQVTFLANQRLRLQANLRQGNDTLAIAVETGLEIIQGRQFKLLNPVAQINGQTVPESILQSLAEGIGREWDLQTLERLQIVARIIQFQITPEELKIAALVRIGPESPLLKPRRQHRRPI